MKHKGIKLAILGVLLFGFGLSILSNTFKSVKLPNENTDKPNEFNLKSAEYWDLSGSLISIDDNDPGKNWAYTALNYDWCSGSGSWTNPYLIENVTIDGFPFSNCIEIKNSSTYFIIRNCTLNDPYSNYFGIYLFNTNNSNLVDNICSDQNEAGIYLDHSYNNTLSGNNVSGYPGNGIELSYSDNNILSGNTLNVYTYGIYLDYSYNNTLSENSAENAFVGARLDYSDNNTLSENTANNNNVGFSIHNSHNNMFSGNTASNNLLGINIRSYSHNNTFSGNTASNNNRGLYLTDCNNNKILGNTINNNDGIGIELWNDNNTTISGNILNNNQEAIFAFGSISCTLSGNLMELCGIFLAGDFVMMASHSIDTTNLVNNKPVYYYVNEIGLGTSDFTNAGQIIVVNCNDSIISGFNLSDCTTGIYLYYSHNNTLSGNTLSNNSWIGIWLALSEDNTLSDNTVNNNDGGISIGGGSNNILSENTANNNKLGFNIQSSHNNTFSGNTVNNNEKGILLYNSNSSVFYENFIQNNEEYGVHIDTGTQNLFFRNYFINNTVHAYDDGINNDWNNSVIGNYWDNYTGIDADNDGIGDMPHSFHGGIDNLPMIEISYTPPPPQNIPGYNVLIILGIISVMAVILFRKKLKYSY